MFGLQIRLWDVWWRLGEKVVETSIEKYKVVQFLNVLWGSKKDKRFLLFSFDYMISHNRNVFFDGSLFLRKTIQLSTTWAPHVSITVEMILKNTKNKKNLKQNRMIRKCWDY